MSNEDEPREADGGDKDENAPPEPSWVAWVERNARPVKRCRPKVERQLTRWQKAGPMSKKDWRKFFEWALEKAMPKEVPMVEQPVPCTEKILPCARAKREMEMEELIEKMENLSKPLPRKVTPKHVYYREEFHYSPVIVWGQPAKHDKGRPFRGPFMPCCFVNKDIEDDYWAQLRFPVRPSALKARPTARILSLAKPHIMPPNPPHCPIPEKPVAALDEPPPKRKKFTPRGWRLHQIRLIYLSKPVSRPEFEYFYM
ncbi:uncharacterized protein LOC132786677 [Drosophila nasuta]|uniref:uncharacterized protein LOC132786677 n=1 Tax=Drosophila nasuta TaxID=42062 RepID=UPI00295EE740|nr:uncharacterized protein LOC132786677 [Drosophila nasuta]